MLVGVFRRLRGSTSNCVKGGWKTIQIEQSTETRPGEGECDHDGAPLSEPYGRR
jgi:hypothetical protein